MNSENELQQSNSSHAVYTHFLVTSLLGTAEVMFVPNRTDYH
jgi:hypothetical protein